MKAEMKFKSKLPSPQPSPAGRGGLALPAPLSAQAGQPLRPRSEGGLPVRVRFAPSPTGFLHIGGLRTALYNYLFARKHRGAFVLRIEDTDRARAVEGGVESIIRTLEWCGLDYDEGVFAPTPPSHPLLISPSGRGRDSSGRGGKIVSPPFEGGVRGGLLLEEHGDYGPYVQSARLDTYKKYAQKLVEQRSAYVCTCSPERLEQMRQEQMARKEAPRYDGHCRTAVVSSQSSVHSRYVIRLKVPEQGSTKFKDIIRGEVEFENALIDDQVLLKSDGFPTYHLANAVDDHLMKITHVIRGEEWLPSTPKHVLLYKAFGWKAPQFAHLPLLLNSDHSKLSKRQGDVAVEDYIKKGYLPEALLNFVALLGWNPRADKELYTLDELVAEFDLKKVNKSGAVVNFEKLDWMNGEYIRARNADELVQLCIPYLMGAGLLGEIQNYKSQITRKFQIQNSKLGEVVDFSWLRQIAALEQERLVKLSDIVEATEYFFVDQPEYDPMILVWKKMDKKDVANNLKGLREFLTQYGGVWDANSLEAHIKTWITKAGRGVGEILWPLRVALSGRAASPTPFDIAAILGKEKTLKRIQYAIESAKKL
ncbi:glutamate--tRNA ligase [Candidatus Uhrbacteria bacterium]|nr:glutamate--tRNA ligase [Candidatus Uhrbacteria bacterium]